MNYVDRLNGDIAARLARTHEIEKSTSMLKMDELKAILHNRGPSNVSSEHNASALATNKELNDVPIE